MHYHFLNFIFNCEFKIHNKKSDRNKQKPYIHLFIYIFIFPFLLFFSLEKEKKQYFYLLLLFRSTQIATRVLRRFVNKESLRFTALDHLSCFWTDSKYGKITFKNSLPKKTPCSHAMEKLKTPRLKQWYSIPILLEKDRTCVSVPNAFKWMIT